MPKGQQVHERNIRHRLGIPDDAERVLIFAETSHWDPNWMLTSEEYFERYVRENLDIAVEELLREPRRVYSIECMFFLRMYWEYCPTQRLKVRQLVNEGRLRITSSGVTTADTILPKTEAILRGLLLGQEWLRTHGMIQEPRVAYFADSFGCSPALPSLLKAAGFNYTAITRIDGMYFPGTGFGPAKMPLHSVSSAKQLLKEKRTLDMIWRDNAGAEVLCHWNAFTYGQGDLLAHRGITRIMNWPFAIPDRSEINVARQVRKFTKQLSPYARTPYMFCPIGFDFVRPIPDLIALLDRYNRVRYPKTGVWLLNAGLDDYLELVNFHRSELPVCELDPNPYWTGFYTARPALKRRCYELIDKLLHTELLSLLSGDKMAMKRVADELQTSWWSAATTNHHDFITGTSPDRIVDGEQLPWLEEAIEQVGTVAGKLEQNPVLQTKPDKQGSIPAWERNNGKVVVHTNDYKLELCTHAGGTITHARHRESGTIFLGNASNDMISYRDSGGLWRMGYEFRGGVWKEKDKTSAGMIPVRIEHNNGSVEFISRIDIQGQTFQRRIGFCQDSALIRFRLIGRAAERHSVTVRFTTPLSPSRLVMDTPGGITTRPLQKVYAPTFWPLYRFVHLQDDNHGWGLAFFQPLPGAISCTPDGTLELVAFRNATRERAFGFVPIPGNPAKGIEKEIYTFDYFLLFTPFGDWRENNLPDIAAEIMPCSDDQVDRNGNGLSSSLFELDRNDVRIMAAKLASRGEGWIVRLYTPSAVGEPFALNGNGRNIRAAYLCDARERDLQALELKNGHVRLNIPGAIFTLRLIF